MEPTKTDFADQFDNTIPFGKALVMRRAGYPGNTDRDQRVTTNIPHLVVHHSPTGFEFGYGGSGAADLALNVCQLYLNLMQYKGAITKCHDGSCWTLAWMLHQSFKCEFVQNVKWNKGATISYGRIDAWFKENMTAALLDQCAVYDETLSEA